MLTAVSIVKNVYVFLATDGHEVDCEQTTKDIV